MMLWNKMIKFFDYRTCRHIELVHKYWKEVSKHFDCANENDSIETHDQSKFSEPEYTPYVHLTWMYKNKGTDNEYEYPKGIEEKVRQATLYHVTENKHHPEFWDDNFIESKLNSKDRDKPSKNIVDATRMPDCFILEMVCDWLAVSEEKGGDIDDWVKGNVNKRWKFVDNQIYIINQAIEYGMCYGK